MEDLIITYVQSNLYWENPIINREHFDNLINQISENTDVIILPEMFSSGFTMNPKLIAEPSNGETLQWMLKKAKQKNCVITGSVSVKENDNYYNRLYWVTPNGEISTYNKRHLFQMGNEHHHYTAGTEKIIVEHKGWRICPLICYDLRFPVWARNTKENTYDLLIYVANWPEIRSYPWKQLLIARAIENQAYVIGVNRVGQDGNGIAHSGDSSVLNPKGELLSLMNASQERVETVKLSRQYLIEFRKVFPVLSDSDTFKVI